MTRNDAFISYGIWNHNDLGQPVLCLHTYLRLSNMNHVLLYFQRMSVTRSLLQILPSKWSHRF